MLAKQYRIVHTKDVQAILKSKNRAYTSSTRIIMKKTDNEKFRLLVIVGKKIFKKANKRNRLRRKVHAVFEEVMSTEALPKNIDCVVHIISKDIILSNSQELKKELLPKVQSLYNLKVSGTKSS